MQIYKGLIVKAIDCCNMNEDYQDEVQEPTLTVGTNYTVVQNGRVFGVIDNCNDFHIFGTDNEWDEFFTLEGVTQGFRDYVRTGTAQMREITADEVNAGAGILAGRGISVSVVDVNAGSPQMGDMVARNPKDFDDKWLVAAKYFKDNFALAE